MLTRRHVLAGGASCLATTAMAPGALQAKPLAYELHPAPVADGIWLISGAQEAITATNGGAIANITILDTEAGAVIVDTGPSLRFGEALSAIARNLTGKDIARVYNTHFHPDHVLGNQAFVPDKIAAPQRVIDDLKIAGNGFSDAMYRIAGDWMRGTEVVLPATALSADVEDFGNRRIRPLAMRGHTASDLVLFDELSGFLIAGDLVFLDRAPTTPHADIDRWIASLANLGSIPHRRLIPGHGPSEDNTRGIDQTRQWLLAIRDIVRDAFEKGLDITEAIALPLPAWTEKIALARYEYERTVMHLYPKFESERWPRVDQE